MELTEERKEQAGGEQGAGNSREGRGGRPTGIRACSPGQDTAVWASGLAAC